MIHIYWMLFLYTIWMFVKSNDVFCGRSAYLMAEKSQFCSSNLWKPQNKIIKKGNFEFISHTSDLFFLQFRIYISQFWEEKSELRDTNSLFCLFFLRTASSYPTIQTFFLHNCGINSQLRVIMSEFGDINSQLWEKVIGLKGIYVECYRFKYFML